MTPLHADDWLTVYQGDCRAVMASMEPESVHCVVTSPPYWGLRDYGTATWDGGDADCDHKSGLPRMSDKTTIGRANGGKGEPVLSAPSRVDVQTPYRGVCGKCGAIRQDSQLGLETTPEEYVANLVDVFREVKRVLRSDGTVWLNLGDSYASSGKSTPQDIGERLDDYHNGKRNPRWELSNRAATPSGLKPKDLVGIPWLVARALQEPYYTGRIRRERDRVWLAAMIDGEGTICGFDHDRADGGGHRSGVHVAITNTSTALLDEAARIWPTSRSAHQRPHAGHLGTKDSWRWIVHGIENKMAALTELYPYLIAKRQQAVVGYTLLTLMADAKRLGHSPQKDAVRAKRRVLTGLLSDLNHQRAVTMPAWLVEPPTMFEPGWYLRSDIIWSKPNPMPESVTDRPTKSHEYLFLLSKRPTYYFDADAVREAVSESTVDRWNGVPVRLGPTGLGAVERASTIQGEQSLGVNPAGRNLRSVWTIATQPYPGAHFATFPRKLVEPCIKAGTSERGVCPECGAPWERVVERGEQVAGRIGTTRAERQPDARYGETRPDAWQGGQGTFAAFNRITRDWQPSCRHWSARCGCGHLDDEHDEARCSYDWCNDCSGAGSIFSADPIPATVLDPFAGSGTTGLVAQSLSRRAILIDLNADYLIQAMGRNRDIPLGLVG